MKSLLILALSFLSMNAFAETASDLTCKAQAKEIAVQTYSNCITQARNSEIEQIRKNYKEELASLKSKYDREIKKMGSIKVAKPTTAATKPARRSTAPTVQEVTTAIEAPKATKGIARQLPTRKATRELPVKAVTDGDNSEGNIIDRESADAEGIDIITMPEVEEVPAT
jgi:ribosomal protein L44E